MEQRRGQGALVVVLAIAALGASFAAGYFYLKSQQSVMPSQVSSMEQVTETTAPTKPSASITMPVATSTQAIQPKKPPHTAVVVFEPPLSGEFTDKSELQLKVINPFLDYYADEYGEGYLVSLAIAQNTKESKEQYPYLATAIFKNGGNSGFVIGKTNGVIQYWVPDCMKCTFSDSFKATYPDIVKNFK